MSIYRDDLDTWSAYVTNELERFYDVSGGITYIWDDQDPARRKRIERHVSDAARSGIGSELAPFYGPAHVVLPLVTAEFRDWWVESWGTQRITFSQWREMRAAERAAEALENSPEAALGALEYLAEQMARRDALIYEASLKGASKAAIARAIGLSRQQVHAIVAAGERESVQLVADFAAAAPAVDPFADVPAADIAPTAEVAPAAEVAPVSAVPMAGYLQPNGEPWPVMPDGSTYDPAEVF